jgi:hypothetical protein
VLNDPCTCKRFEHCHGCILRWSPKIGQELKLGSS